MCVDLRRRAGSTILNAVVGALAVIPSAPLDTAKPRRRLIENPKTFYVALSRAQWRELPFAAFADAGWIGQPSLVFDELDELTAMRLQLDIERLAAKRRRAWKPEMRRYLAMLMRRKHLARVALAVGYTWPGNPPGHIEFAPDA